MHVHGSHVDHLHSWFPVMGLLHVWAPWPFCLHLPPRLWTSSSFLSYRVPVTSRPPLRININLLDTSWALWHGELNLAVTWRGTLGLGTVQNVCDFPESRYPPSLPLEWHLGAEMSREECRPGAGGPCSPERKLLSEKGLRKEGHGRAGHL